MNLSTQRQEDQRFEILKNLSVTNAVDKKWCVLVADIEGSTSAVQRGQLKEVNLVGAASIAAIRNQFDQTRVPYVFGGDGATFLCHQDDLQICKDLLVAVQDLAINNFKLVLRVGSVSVASVYEQGGDIRLGFLPWTKHESMPFFRGNGISMAEHLIKNQLQTNKPNELSSGPKIGSVEGLSCHLSPFVATRGRILSVLVEPRVPMSEEDALFQQIFQSLGDQNKLLDLSPIKKQTIKRNFSLENLFSESRLHQKTSGTWSFVKQFVVEFFSEVIARIVFAFDIKNGVIGKPSDYAVELVVQSDWIKCDGMLRMVLDLTPQEEASLRQKLSELKQDGKVFFGIQTSQNALLTCYVKSPIGQRHVHFVDGGNGGFTSAAIELKDQKKLAAGVLKAAS